MENIIEILKYIGPFIGVFIGWLLTRKNDNDKIKYSEIRQIKRSLYILLEIRNQIAVTKRMDKYFGILIERLNLIFKEYTDDRIESEQFKGLIKQILPSLIGDNFQKNLKEQFDKCIDNLSEIDPILTYRINGKQNIQDYIQSWENETKSYLELESVNDMQNVIEHFKPKLVEEIKNDIEEIILELAELIGKKEIERVKKLIAEPEEIEMQIDVDAYLERIFSGILEPNILTKNN